MIYFVHEPIKKFFHDLLGFQRYKKDKDGNDTVIPRDVIFASNEYSYRRRVEKEGKLLLPYMSYNFLNAEPDDEAMVRKQVLKGVNVSHLDLKVKAEPTIFTYEGLIVCNKTSVLYEFIERLRATASNDTFVDVPVKLRSTDPYENVPIYLDLTSIEKSPDSNENEWLEKNNIKIVEITFDVKGLMFHSHSSIQKIEKFIPEFYADILEDYDNVDNERFQLNWEDGNIDKYPNEL